MREPKSFHRPPCLRRPSTMHFDSNRSLHPKLLDGDYAELASAATKVVENVSFGCLCQSKDLPNVPVALIVFGA